MKLFYCGFNGFHQIGDDEVDSSTDSQPQIDVLVPIPLRECTNLISDIDLWLGWSKLLIVTDGRVYVKGLWNKKIYQGIVGRETAISRIASTENYLVGIDDKKCLKKLSCWSDEAGWEDVPTESADNEPPVEFIKVCSNENSILALDIKGMLYVPPVKLDVDGTKFIDISCGSEHFMALAEDGSVYTWGMGSRGQLGHGAINSLEEPTRVEALGGVKMTQISAGGWHSCCLSEFGDVYIWGWNESGQLAAPCRNLVDESAVKSESRSSEECVSVQSEPRLLDHPIPFSEDHVNVTSICCGSRHTAVTLGDKSGWSWGWNEFGQLGSGDRKSRYIPVRVMENVDKVTCGSWSTIWWSHRPTEVDEQEAN